uniref:arginine kinase n=1 Tax=Parastrongyloides trichosuri TaxID=131310 RepID=A0A0N4ZXA5_PARTI
MTSAYSNILRNNFFKVFIAGSVGAGAVCLIDQNRTCKKKLSSSCRSSVDPAVLKKLEEAYAKLNGPEGKDCKSLLKKHLTRETLDNLKNKKTALGATLYDVIQSGVANLDSGVGIYAPDAESYNTFAELFDKIIKEYHGVDPNKKKQPPVDMDVNKCKEFKPLDPQGKYIKSTRIRCGRTLGGYPFNPLLTEANYKEMEEKVRKSLETVKDTELKGTYYPLTGMTKETQNQLIKDHFLFKEGDRFLQAANACRFWPTGRGIFHNSGKTFLVWVNEEDHLRLISMQQGSDVGAVFSRLIRGVQAIEKVVPFKRDERLGQLLFCPTNIGCSIRASVHIKLPKLSARKDFKQICEKLNLQIRGIDGEHSESKGGVYDISNKARLGLSEYEAVKQMYDGVKKLIEMEEAEK